MNKNFAGGLFASVAAVALLMGATPAQAADTIWNTNGSNPSGTTCASTANASCVTANGTTQLQGLSTAGNPSNLTTQYGNEFTFMDSTGALALSARSFFVDTGNTSTLTGATTTTLATASLQVYGAGLGVTSKTIVGNGTTASPQFLEQNGSAPGHTTDNGGVFDIVAFKFPQSTYEVEKLTLSMFGSAPGAGLGDFTYFIGNGDASLTSLADLTSHTLGDLTASHGFTQFLCDAAGAGGPGTNNCSGPGTQDAQGQVVSINSQEVTGQYLIVAASITNANRNDDFKIGVVDGVIQSTTKTPEPATLLMFATGGFMAWRIRRRRQATA